MIHATTEGLTIGGLRAAELVERFGAPLWVIDERGRRGFLRGMNTHELVSHGFAFDDAFAIASAVGAASVSLDRVITLTRSPTVTGFERFVSGPTE